MDIFKILSRSTSLSKGAKPGSARNTVPSSGQNESPQLFKEQEKPVDHEVTVNVLGKRKRAGANGATAVEVPPELDFFGETGQAKGDRKKTRENGGHGIVFGAPTSESYAAKSTVDVVTEEDEEAFRKILRSHKIKITRLSRPENSKDLPTSKERKSKKGRGKDTPDEKTETNNVAKNVVYPRPLMAFTQLRTRYKMGTTLARNIEDEGYRVPTEVQLASLPLLLGEETAGQTGKETGVHLLSVAPTGSGKTVAFLIPIIDALLKRRKSRRPVGQPTDDVIPEEYTGPSAVVIAPTKELASQIVNEARKLALKTGLKVSLLRKGMVLSAPSEANLSQDASDGESEDEENDSDDSDDASKSAVSKVTVTKSDIIVATPLALINALKKTRDMTPLAHPLFLVLDEADVLLDPLFKDQTMEIWDACTNPALRTTCWSATMPSSIESVILDTLARRGDDAPIFRLVVGIKDSAVPNIEHKLTYAATEAGKLLALRQLLHPTSGTADSSERKALRPPFLVFTQTIPRAVALHAELKFDIPAEAGGSSRIAVLHSGLSEGSRSKAMAGFRRGEIWVIITTDLLARGVDFRGLNGVVNYDAPTSAAAYVHRVGRTGRAGRAGGVAVTLYTKDDVPYIKSIANVIAASEKLRASNGASNGAADAARLQSWLVKALPTPSKRDKQELKKKGVESRRIGAKGAMISTKSKYDRKLEGKRRMRHHRPTRTAAEQDGGSDFGGFDE